MENTTKTFWNFLLENLSIIKTVGLLSAIAYTLVTLSYVIATLDFLIQAQYTEGVVKDNVLRTYTCYTRHSNSYSCTDSNTIMSYFDVSGNERSFQAIIFESQEIGKTFTVLYDSEGGITLLEQGLMLWFYIFIFSTMIPIYLMIYRAYMENIASYKKGEEISHKKIYERCMIFWFGFIGISLWFGGTLFLYFGGDRIMSYLGFLVFSIAALNIFRNYKKN